MFFVQILASKITKLCFGFDIIWCQNISAKCVHKMLMKLTPEGIATTTVAKMLTKRMRNFILTETVMLKK